MSGFFFKDPPKNWWPAHVDPLEASDAPESRALMKNTPAMKQYTPMEAVKTGILPLMWFVLLCTAGINIFGIAMQVPFGKEVGFAGGIVALAMTLKAIVNGTGRGVIGWMSDRYGGRGHSSSSASSWRGPVRNFFSGSISNLPLFLLASMVSGLRRRRHLPDVRGDDCRLLRREQRATNYGLVYSSRSSPAWSAPVSGPSWSATGDTARGRSSSSPAP